MYLNPGITAQISTITPAGTNSTMFTECCDTAITAEESKCPKCGRPVVGYDSPASERTKIRWKSATRNWNRNRG